MKNCRNCKFAAWFKASNGRRLFGNWAECTFKVIAVIPSSRSLSTNQLTGKVGVYRHDNKPMECAAWQKVEPAPEEAS